MIYYKKRIKPLLNGNENIISFKSNKNIYDIKRYNEEIHENKIYNNIQNEKLFKKNDFNNNNKCINNEINYTNHEKEFEKLKCNYNYNNYNIREDNNKELVKNDYSRTNTENNILESIANNNIEKEDYININNSNNKELNMNEKTKLNYNYNNIIDVGKKEIINEEINNKFIKENFTNLNCDNSNEINNAQSSNIYDISPKENQKEEIISIKIIEYNRKGKIVNDMGQIEKINKKLIDELNNKQHYNNNNFLYIETLPLILADFLQSNKSYAIIEIENELCKELYSVFDKKLINFINEYDELMKSENSNITIKNYQLQITIKEYMKIKANLKLFNDILNKKKQMNEKAEYIEKLIEKFIIKEAYLEHKIKILQEKQSLLLLDKINNINNEYYKSNSKIINLSRNMESRQKLKIFNSMNNHNLSQLTLNNNKQISNSNYINLINNDIKIIYSNKIDRNKKKSMICDEKNNINNSLKDIFDFYSKKHNIIGHSLFSRVEEKKSHMDLNEFSKFCSDFNIPIKQKIVTIFKKNANSKSKLMNFKGFQKSLEELAIEMFERKKKYLKEKISKEKEKYKQLELKENQRIEDDNLKKIFDDELNENNMLIKFSFISNNNEGKNKKYFLSQKSRLKKEINNIKSEYNNSLKKTFKEINEEFYDYLGLEIYNKKYRTKMKGYKESPLKLNNLKIKNKNSINIDLYSNNENTNPIMNGIKTNNIAKKIYLDNNRLININNNKKKSNGNIFRRNEENNIFLKNDNIKKTDLNIRNINDKKNNRIWWSKLRYININDLNLSDKDKNIFSSLDNINDNIICEIPNEKDYNNNLKNEKENYCNKHINLRKVKLIKNNSSININSKNKYGYKKIVLPQILNNNNYYFIKYKKDNIITTSLDDV